MKQLFKTTDKEESSVLLLVNANTDLTARNLLKQLTNTYHSDSPDLRFKAQLESLNRNFTVLVQLSKMCVVKQTLND
jgi:hypothetical protein